MAYALQVLSISLDSQGQWLASGSSDGTVKVWESATGRCIKTWDLATPVSRVAWCPNADLCLLAAATQNRLLLINASKSSHAAKFTWLLLARLLCRRPRLLACCTARFAFCTKDLASCYRLHHLWVGKGREAQER